MTKPKICECGHKASDHSRNWGCEAFVSGEGACGCVLFVESFGVGFYTKSNIGRILGDAPEGKP